MKALLVDDHVLFREGLELLVEQAYPHLVLRHAGDLAEAAVVIAREGDVKLALLDLALPDSHGLNGLRHLRAVAPQVTMVVLSADDSPDTVLACVEAGAAGFIPKKASARELREALGHLLSGHVPLPPAVLSGAPASMPHVPGEPLGLSPRQLDVLRLLIEGKPNKLICRELSLAESTVKTHLAAIFRRLDVNTRTQAVVAAARLGLRLVPEPEAHSRSWLV